MTRSNHDDSEVLQCPSYSISWSGFSQKLTLTSNIMYSGLFVGCMSDPEGGWHYAGQTNVSSEGRVSLPERLFEDGILHPNRVAYWSYEVGAGFLIVSNQPLEKDIYKTQDNSNIGDPPGYWTTIPKMFFSDYKGRGRGSHEQPVPEIARVEYSEKRFFAYRTEMAEGDVRSCYVFTWGQFDNTIGDDSWADPLDDIPRFS